MSPHRTALITGASRGLGRALARALAKDGWQLILDARGADALDTVRRELEKVTTVAALAGDITDTVHRKALVDAVKSAGGLDALVNNASTLGISPRPTLLEYPPKALEQVYRTNVIAPLALMQAVFPHLKPQARILNISSDAGVEPYEGWGGYGSSKAALDHLTAIFAAEHPELRVYAVDPGDMNTQMHQEAFPGEDISDRPQPEESVPGLLILLAGTLPSGRYQARKVGLPETGVREFRLALTTPNPDEALAFYRDRLGMPVMAVWEGPGRRGYLLDAGHRATLEIFNEGQAAYVDAIEVGRRTAGQVRIALEVADVHRLTAAIPGESRLSNVVQTPWGDQNVRVLGPDDLQVTLYQVSGEAIPVSGD